MEYEPHFVGTSCLTPGRHNSFKVLSQAKLLLGDQCRTIIGGPHADIMAEQIRDNYPFIDYIVKGEGEKTLFSVIMDTIIDIGKSSSPDGNCIINTEPLLDINSIPFPAWDLAHLESDRYIGNADIRVPIIASRGCKGHCTFCSTWKFWKKYRVRKAENIVNEIEYIVNNFNKKHFVFEDDSLSCNINTSKEILNSIIEHNLGIKFFATMRADGIDDELAQLLKEAGCYGVSIGFESGSQKVLDIYKKGITVEQNIQAAKTVKSSGLQLCALMIYGGVLEGPETSSENRKFIEEIKPDNVGTLSQLWILPGTHLYYLMKKEGFIDDSYWLGSQPYYVYKGEIDYLFK